MILPIQVILSTRQDGSAGLEAKDLSFHKNLRFFLSGGQTGAKAQNDNNFDASFECYFILFSTTSLI
jgi:hypothetical protein